jgi:hypothetical protein
MMATNTLDTKDPKVQGPRMVRHTEKAKLLFEENFVNLQDKFVTSCRDIEDIIDSFDSECFDRTYLRKMEDSMNSAYTRFVFASTNLMDFLGNAKTERSYKELDAHVNIYNKYSATVQVFRDTLSQIVLEAVERLSKQFETRSAISASNRSNTSSVAIQKRIKAERQSVRLKFLEEQATLEKQKASAEIDIKLSHEKEAAAIAQAEAVALEQFETGSVINNTRPKTIFDTTSINTERYSRTVEYVKDQASYMRNSISLLTKDVPSHPSYKLNPDALPYQERYMSDTVSRTPLSENVGHELNPNAVPYQGPITQNQNSVLQDMSHFLLKKDFLMHRFSSFDDSATNFTTWKVSFISIVRELKVTPLEELDLLTKWLGPESKKYAVSIRTANIFYPQRGLNLIWDRLENRYG